MSNNENNIFNPTISYNNISRLLSPLGRKIIQEFLANEETKLNILILMEIIIKHVNIYKDTASPPNASLNSFINKLQFEPLWIFTTLTILLSLIRYDTNVTGEQITIVKTTLNKQWLLITNALNLPTTTS